VPPLHYYIETTIVCSDVKTGSRCVALKQGRHMRRYHKETANASGTDDRKGRRASEIIVTLVAVIQIGIRRASKPRLPSTKLVVGALTTRSRHHDRFGCEPTVGARHGDVSIDIGILIRRNTIHHGSTAPDPQKNRNAEKMHRRCSSSNLEKTT
jgi:hypothetical protein